jgi:hypothetical protein
MTSYCQGARLCPRFPDQRRLFLPVPGHSGLKGRVHQPNPQRPRGVGSQTEEKRAAWKGPFIDGLRASQLFSDTAWTNPRGSPR